MSPPINVAAFPKAEVRLRTRLTSPQTRHPSDASATANSPRIHDHS